MCIGPQGAQNDKKMCHELQCYDPYQARCWAGAERRAANGTTCGDRKVIDRRDWCCTACIQLCV